MSDAFALANPMRQQAVMRFLLWLKSIGKLLSGKKEGEDKIPFKTKELEELHQELKTLGLNFKLNFAITSSELRGWCSIYKYVMTFDDKNQTMHMMVSDKFHQPMQDLMPGRFINKGHLTVGKRDKMMELDFSWNSCEDLSSIFAAYIQHTLKNKWKISVREPYRSRRLSTKEFLVSKKVLPSTVLARFRRIPSLEDYSNWERSAFILSRLREFDQPDVVDFCVIDPTRPRYLPSPREFRDVMVAQGEHMQLQKNRNGD